MSPTRRLKGYVLYDLKAMYLNLRVINLRVIDLRIVDLRVVDLAVYCLRDNLRAMCYMI